MDRLPDPQISTQELEAYRDVYRDLIGFLPPRIQARTDMLSRLDPETLALQEQLRKHLMYPSCFDTKTAQLMLFAILLALLSDAARLHAIAARRAGASWDELNAVVGLCFLFRGLPAANLGSQVLQEINKSEQEQADVSPAGVEQR